jgi:ribosomal protein L40E
MMSTQTGQCPKCRALNAYTATNCIECGARLPWADVAQQSTPSTAAQPPEMPPGVLMEAKGINGQVQLLEDRVKIKRQTPAPVRSQGAKKDKEILLTSVSSIQLKQPGRIVNGSIRFDIRGGNEMDSALLQAAREENTVTFNTEQEPGFTQLKEAVEKQRVAAMAKLASFAAPAAVSNHDALKRLTSLRDRGILTEEEFQERKKRVLGY